MRILIVPVVAVALSLAPEARAELGSSRSARLLAADPMTPAVSLLAGQAEESAPAEATAEVVPKHAISISPLLVLGPLLGLYPIAIEYEMALTDAVSIYASPAFIYINNPVVTGWILGLNVGARYYLMNGPAIRGLWVGGDVGVAMTSAGGRTGLSFGVDALVGYNFLFGAFEFSPGIGASYAFGSTPGLVLRLNVGYAF